MKRFLGFSLPRKRTVLVTAAVILVLFGVVSGRVVLSARAEYLDAHAAEKRALRRTDPTARSQGLHQAIVHYRRAARWYAPGNGYVTRSLDRLWGIGRLAEKQDDAKTALMAYRAIRRAILGARSFYTPHQDRLDQANRRIAVLSARLQGKQSGASAEQIDRYEKWHLAQLRRDTAPSVGWSILALLGFLGWIGGAVGFIFRAVTPEDRFQGHPALRWGLVIVVCLGLWLLGLVKA